MQCGILHLWCEAERRRRPRATVESYRYRRLWRATPTLNPGHLIPHRQSNRLRQIRAESRHLHRGDLASLILAYEPQIEQADGTRVGSAPQRSQDPFVLLKLFERDREKLNRSDPGASTACPTHAEPRCERLPSGGPDRPTLPPRRGRCAQVRIEWLFQHHSPMPSSLGAGSGSRRASTSFCHKGPANWV